MSGLYSDLDKATFGTRPPEDQTEFDHDHYVTLTVKVKLLNLAKIAINLLVMNRFD